MKVNEHKLLQKSVIACEIDLEAVGNCHPVVVNKGSTTINGFNNHGPLPYIQEVRLKMVHENRGQRSFNYVVPSFHNFAQAPCSFQQNFIHAHMVPQTQVFFHPFSPQFPLQIPLPVISQVSNDQIETNTTGFMAFREFNLGNYANSEILCYKWITEQGETVQCYILLGFISLRLRHLTNLESIATKLMSMNAAVVEPFVFRAICLKERGKISEAIGYYRLALQIRPDNIDAFIGLSNCYSILNDFNTAASFLVMGLNRYPDSIVLRYEFANIFRMAGRLDDAKKCFEAVINFRNDFAPSYLSLGQVHLAQGLIWLALHHFERALSLDIYLFDAYLIYANTLRELKLIDKSIRTYMKGITFFPEQAQLYSGLGCSFLEGGMHDAAIENFKHALSLQPNYADVYCNLANALKEKGLIDEAEQNYFNAIKIAPNHADSYNNLANIYRERGKISQSIAFYQKSLEVCPGFGAAHSNLATVYQQLGKLSESITHFQLAVSASPNNPEVICYLGNAYKELGNFKSAADCFIRAISLNNFSPEAHAFLANTYKDMGLPIEAIAEYTSALRYRSNFVEIFCSLVHTYLLVAQWDNYTDNCKKVIDIVVDQLENNRPPAVHPHHTMLFNLKPEHRVAIASKHAISCLDRVHLLGYFEKDWSVCDLPYDNLIKIGYVSSDFCNHPTSHLIQSIPGLHDRARFKVYCYSLTPSDQSSFRIKIESEVDCFVDVSSISDPNEIARMIQGHGIHILLNLNGYTKGARNEIFALKPAPVQIMYLGYPGTSGASYMDYIITDPVVCPLEYEKHYSEKFAYMPNSFFIGDHANLFPHVLNDLTKDRSIASKIAPFEEYITKSSKILNCARSAESGNCTDLGMINDEEDLKSYINYHSKKRDEVFQNSKNSGERIPDSNNIAVFRSQFGIPENAFVYCNFNQIYKFDPTTFEVWCSILKRVPNSYLWLLRFPKYGEENLRRYVKNFDFDQSKLIFTEVSLKEEHVRRGQLADVCLDTPLCNGHTTGMDVLWAGCPVVTFPLETFASRVGASIITSIGLGDHLIAKSYKEYENIAVKLGTDKEYYREIKSMVWYGRITSTLFNTKIYTAGLDDLLSKIWEMYKKDRKVCHTTINDSE